MDALIGVIVSAVLSLLLWYLNSRTQHAQIARNYAETIQTMQQNEKVLRDRVSELEKSYKEVMRGIHILIDQLVENGLEPKWRPNGNKDTDQS